MSNQLTPINNTGLSQSEFSNALQQALKLPFKNKTYTAQITRDSPSAFIFLLDQSGSMSEKISFRNEKISKSEAVALIVNETLNDIINRCQKADEVRDYFEIAVIGYGGKNQDKANFAWEGTLESKTFVSTSALATSFLSKKDIIVDILVRGQLVPTPKTIRTWIRPLAEKLTPMRHALQLTAELLEDWLVRHRNKDIFPPIVINITDGEATDGKEKELIQAAHRIKDLHTTDGNVLLLNVHLSSAASTSVLFPTYSHELPNNEYAQLLFKMSSDMPAVYNSDIARYTGRDTSGAYTGMAFNADAKALISMMQIGTLTSMGKTQPA